ncbi:MAG: neutral/alkaline non-lysosomal ceramidase N-terminal domain-containing protein [Thermomicrobiales bacterium]
MTGQNAVWMAGAARLPFPIAPGTPLAGYAARTGSATGTRDPLTIGALALAREGVRLVIVAADIIAVDAALVDEIAAAAGLDKSELALCASHTHSGPAGVVARLHPADPDRLDPELRSRFVATAADAIATALSRMEAVDLQAGVADSNGVATNRNDVTGPYDPHLSVLATRRRDGSIQAVMAHFACHPTILGADNRAVSADFPGALRCTLAASLIRSGRTPLVLFVNGAAGDVSTRFTRRGQDGAEVERVGNALAETARHALGRARTLAGPIRHRHAMVDLPPRQPPMAVVGAATPASTPLQKLAIPAAGQARIAETRAQGAAMLAALSALPDGGQPSSPRLDAWTLGGLTLVTIPGELSAALGRHVSARNLRRTLILGYANGYAGYLADRAAYEAETYEAMASPFGPGAGEGVANAAATLVSH